MGVRLYCGVNETKWNHHPVAPGNFACISPVFGSSIKTKQENRIKVPKHTLIIQDSGAFCDGLDDRLSFKEAMERQLEHSKKYGYFNQREAVASYDLLIDEKWDVYGKRHKERWSERESIFAVKQTIEAARYLNNNRDRVGVPLVLSCQGVTSKQYLNCAKEIISVMETDDILGLGGWCIVGKRPAQLMPSFKEIISLVIPYAAKNGVSRVHIWGVCYAPALGTLLWLCDKHNILLSTDSAGPQVRPIRGQWGYMGWVDKDYKREPVETRGIHRKKHVEATRNWLNNLENTKWYMSPKYQLKMNLETINSP